MVALLRSVAMLNTENYKVRVNITGVDTQLMVS